MTIALALALLAATTVAPPVEVGTVLYASGWPDGALVERPLWGSGDPDGDGELGVGLDPGEHVEFMAESTGLPVDGTPTVVMFAAASLASEPAALSFELLRCEAGECTPLSATTVERSPWGADDLAEIRAELPSVTVAPVAGAFLCLRVANTGVQVMRVGFGSERHPAAVWLPTGATLAAPAPPTRPASTETSTPDDRRDLLSGTIGVRRPPPPSPFPIVLGVAAVLLVGAVAAAILWIGAQTLRTRRLPAHPARR